MNSQRHISHLSILSVGVQALIESRYSLRKFRGRILYTLVASFLLLSPLAQAQQKIEMEVTVFKGNKELPKVLYIVPWKRLADGNLKQKLVLHSLFEEAFDPIEPEAFQRYVEDYNYYVQKAE
jgi:hypothetical protein